MSHPLTVINLPGSQADRSWWIHKDDGSYSFDKGHQEYSFTISRIQSSEYGIPQHQVKRLTANVSRGFFQALVDGCTGSQSLRLPEILDMRATVSSLLSHVLQNETNGKDFGDTNGHLSFTAERAAISYYRLDAETGKYKHYERTVNVETLSPKVQTIITTLLKSIRAVSIAIDIKDPSTKASKKS